MIMVVFSVASNVRSVTIRSVIALRKTVFNVIARDTLFTATERAINNGSKILRSSNSVCNHMSDYQN